MNIVRQKYRTALHVLGPRYVAAIRGRTTFGYYTQRWYASDNRKVPCDNTKILKSRFELNSCKEPKKTDIKKASVCNKGGDKPLPTPPPAEIRVPCPPRKTDGSGNKKSNYMILAGVAALGALGLGAYLLLGSKDTEEGTTTDATEKRNAGAQRVPTSSADIPKQVPYLLIGGGTASFAAFRAIKSSDPKAKVMVITNEIEMPYMRPPLSKEMWTGGEDQTKLNFKQWNGKERSLFYEPDDFYVSPDKLMSNPNGGVAIVRGYTVKHIDVSSRTVKLCDGTEIKYDECLLATGSQPKNLDVFSSASNKIKERVSVFKTVEDFEHLKDRLKNAESVAVVGGGFLGSELSCALTKFRQPVPAGEERKGLKVYQVFYEKGNMGKVLPTYLSQWTTERIREEGVNVIPETQVENVKMQDNRLRLKLLNGQDLLVDHVVVAVGSKPNTALAVTSGLEVDDTHGGYVVNAELEARRHLYVAGDAACFYDPKLGRRRVEHHDHAVVSGRLAGENMVGQKKPYKHQSMFWSDLGPQVGYEAIGIVDATLPTVGVFAKASPNDTPAASGTDNLTPKTYSGDTPLEPVKASSESTPKPTSAQPAAVEEGFGKGVLFYLRDEKVVGIVLWNVFNRINTARAIINENKKWDDLNELAKLFEIHT